MRIGLDVTPLRLCGGGIKRYTESLLSSLASIDRANDYELCGYVPPAYRSVNRRRFTWTEVDFPFKSWLDQVYVWGAASGVDLFHATNYSAPLLNGFPLVLTVHDLTVHLFPETHPRARRLRHLFLPRHCRRAVRVIADSYNTKADLVRHYRIPDEKIDVVYLAAGDEFRPVRSEAELRRVRLKYGLPEPFVLFVGSVEPRKNLPALIRAFGALAREGFPHRLVIAGVGTPRYVQEIRRVAQSVRLEPESDVVFTGHVADCDLPALYSLCELFVYPSLYEGFGLPPIEAMACGAPVLLPANSSFSELYEGCSAMFDATRTEALTDAVRNLLRDPALRSEHTEEGLKRAQSRSWDDVARETLDVYRRAARGA